MPENQGIVSTVVDRVTLRGVEKRQGKAGVNAYIKEQMMAFVGAAFFPLTATAIEALSGGKKVQTANGQIVEGRSVDLTGWSGFAINLAASNLVGMAIDSPGFQAGANGAAMMQVMYAELDTKVLSGIFGKRLHRLNTSVQSSLADNSSDPAVAIRTIDQHGNTTPQALPERMTAQLPTPLPQPAISYTVDQVAEQVAHTLREQQKWGNGANHVVPQTQQTAVADTALPTPPPPSNTNSGCSGCQQKHQSVVTPVQNVQQHDEPRVVALADQHGSYKAKSWKTYKNHKQSKQWGRK